MVFAPYPCRLPVQQWLEQLADGGHLAGVVPVDAGDGAEDDTVDAGVNGVILSPVTSVDGYHPGNVTAVGELLKPLLAG